MQCFVTLYIITFRHIMHYRTLHYSLYIIYFTLHYTSYITCKYAKLTLYITDNIFYVILYIIYYTQIGNALSHYTLFHYTLNTDNIFYVTLYIVHYMQISNALSHYILLHSLTLCITEHYSIHYR